MIGVTSGAQFVGRLSETATMKTEKETVAILVLLALVLGPMWFFALSSHSSTSAVVLSPDKGAINPTETFLPTPVEVNEFVAGVITWLAVFALVGMIYYTHHFIRTVGESGESAVTEREGQVAADGGINAAIPPYILAGGRRLVDYWPAKYATPGVAGVAIMAWSTASFSVLFVLEVLTWARTQYLGIYGGMALLSIGVLGAIYTTWFLPSMQVVEKRGHEGKFTTESDGEN